MPAEVETFSSLEALSRHAAAVFAALARASVERQGYFAAALSGGSTPRRLYEILAEKAGEVPWPKVHLFQVDERAVPPSDAESNFRMIREALLDRVPQAAENFHRMEAERRDREAAARDYSRRLASVLQATKLGLPRLDLILLGMGNDGHTASLFPGSAALKEREAWVCQGFNAALKSHRLTLTLPVLNAAADVIFLVAGADKAETLRRVLSAPDPSHPLPAQLVQPTRGRVRWFVDEAAASRLGAAARRVS